MVYTESIYYEKALMLCIKAFSCRHSGEKVEG